MPATQTDRLYGLTTSVAVKPPCRVSAASNITLAGLQTIGGVALATGDRVLVRSQSNSVDNGIYVVNTSAWSRAPDFDGPLDAVQGTVVIVESESDLSRFWEVTTANPVVIGSSAMTFTPVILDSASILSFYAAFVGATQRTMQNKARDIVSVKDGGAVGDGTTNDTAAILAADTSGAQLLFPPGTYLYNSNSNPTLTTGVKMDNATMRSTVVTDTLKHDPDGNLIGLHHNHLQVTSIASPITNGKIVAPPISRANIKGDVDILVHFYNDFGLEWTRLQGPRTSAPTWYTWEWNHVGQSGYDASRHPVMGWYRGDDANVLDWISYDLREAGVTAVGVYAPDINVGAWSASSDDRYWAYQLINNAPNFRGLKFFLPGKYDVSAAACLADWQSIIYNFINVYDNYYSININGRICPVIFVFDGEGLRTTLGGTSQLQTFLRARAAEAVSLGYGGLAVIARNPTANISSFSYAEEENFNVYYFPGGYEVQPAYSPGATTYNQLVDNYAPPDDQRSVLCITTSAKSVPPHPSSFDWPGTTPGYYRRWLNKAINNILNTYKPRMLIAGNVSEWAENGPGLMADRLNGWGYLDAVKAAIGTGPSIVDPYPVVKQYAESTLIYSVHDTVQIWVSNADPYTVIATPSVAPGRREGQLIRLVCVPEFAAYSIILQDNATLVGSTLFLDATTVTLGPWDSIQLQWFTGKGWVQVGQVVNVL